MINFKEDLQQINDIVNSLKGIKDEEIFEKQAEYLKNKIKTIINDVAIDGYNNIEFLKEVIDETTLRCKYCNQLKIRHRCNCITD